MTGREILFRGKRKDNGEWVWGNLFIPDIPNTPTQICIGTNVIRITYDIDPFTIGQYTGLTDKNGKKIFEGDIVNVHKTQWQPLYDNCKGEVYFNNGAYLIKGVSDVLSLYAFHLCCEVIGNIHDNEELCKEVK